MLTPYYVEEALKDNANVMFYLGAEMGTTQDHNEETVIGYTEEQEGIENTIGFGKSIARDLAAITEETKVSPLLNIRYKEITLPIDNQVLVVAGKAGLFENCVKNVDGVYSVVTEIGYMELGDELKHFYTGVSYRHCMIWKNCLQMLRQKVWQNFLEWKCDEEAR